MSVIPSTPQAPQSAQVNTNNLVEYSDTTPFNGFLWLGLELPSAGTYTQPTLWNSYRYTQLPRYIQIPIIAGQIDQTTQVFLTTQQEPPGTQYVAYWFDAEGNLIAPTSGTATPFSITDITYIITPPTLNKPSYSGAVPPTPEN